ncbi:MAG: hypothetical protein M1492_06940 [Gammaproteobacteria bacterium]|nr:hypothetical protein [Gammaproteobacteria bacterium]
MTPAEVITEIVHLGGKIWPDGDRLKFRDVPARLVPAIRDHKAALLALLKDAQTDQRSTPSASVAPEPAMAPQSAPAHVYCRDCAKFRPGIQRLSVGACTASVTGQPPAGGHGDYRACYPTAPRSCPDYRGSET